MAAGLLKRIGNGFCEVFFFLAKVVRFSLIFWQFTRERSQAAGLEQDYSSTLKIRAKGFL